MQASAVLRGGNMANFKVLITGKNTLVIDDFFDHLRDSFYTMSTSMRYDDIIHHLDVFKPDIMVYCLYNEKPEDVSRVLEIKRRLAREDIPFVIIGTREECDDFQRETVYMADITLTKPLAAATIQKQITAYMHEKKSAEEAKEQAAKEAYEQRQHAAAAGSASFTAPAGAKKKSVLVIDDDPMMLKLIKEHLSEMYDVSTAISGKIAYKYLETRTPDLILLDYEMPVENGPAVLDHIRVMGGQEDVPVVFLTGVTDRNRIAEALKMKPQGYLLKPIDRVKLMETVGNFIR